MPHSESKSGASSRPTAETDPTKAKTKRQEWQPITPLSKSKLDREAFLQQAGGQNIKNKIQQWQDICQTPVLSIDSMSQKTERRTAAASGRAASKEDERKGAGAEDRAKSARRQHPPVTPITAPKKRVVSDEHWRNDRTKKDPSKSCPRPQKVRAAVTLMPFMTPQINADGKVGDAWVRPKKSLGTQKSTPRKKTTPIKAGEPATFDDILASGDAAAPETKVGTWLQKETTDEGSPEPRRPRRSRRSKEAESSLLSSHETPPPALEPFSFDKLRATSNDTSGPGPAKGSKNRIEAWLTAGSDPFTDDSPMASRSNDGISDGSAHKPRAIAELRLPRTRKERSVEKDDSPEDVRKGPAISTHSDSPSSLRRSGARRRSAAAKMAMKELQDLRASQSNNSPVYTPESLDDAIDMMINTVRGDGSSAERSKPPPREKSTQPPNVTLKSLQDLDKTHPPLKSIMKPRMTSHADLMSVLSVPVATVHGPRRDRESSKPDDRSSKLEQVLKDLKADEETYLRDLATLIDGVVPVLLKTVLSQSKGTSTKEFGAPEAHATAPIVAIGICLERLKSVHKRMPVDSVEGFISWAQTARQVYSDYIAAWKLGFEDVVINLTPAPPNSGLPLLTNGEERLSESADVTYLLKRPLVRIKYLAKTLKGVTSAQGTPHGATCTKQYQELLEQAKERQNFERARLEDESAARIDTTKARGLLTLQLAPGTTIDQRLSVRARDYFDMTMKHNTGQHMDSRIELIVREMHGKSDIPGDLLICQVDSESRWLLFPPMPLNRTSARFDRPSKRMILMLRAIDDIGTNDFELLSLNSSDVGALHEWIEMIGSKPMPPIVLTPAPNPAQSVAQSVLSLPEPKQRITSKQVKPDVPIGESTPRVRFAGAEISNEDPHPIQKVREYLKVPEYVPRSVLSAASRSTLSEVSSRHTHSDVQSHSTGRTSEVSDYKSPVRTPQPRPASRETYGSDVSDKTPRSSRDVTPKQHATNLSSFNLEPENLSDYGAVNRHLRYGIRFKPSPEPSKQSRAEYRDSSSRDDPQTASRSSQARPLPQPPGLTTPQKQRGADLNNSPAGSLLSQPTPPGPRTRASSPLKQEYAPSIASRDSSVDGVLLSDHDDDENDDAFSDTSMEDSIVPPLPPLHMVKTPLQRPALPTIPSAPASITPSQSASQVPVIEEPQPNFTSGMAGGQDTAIASIFSWSDRGCWDSLHSEECSVVVSPGLIEVFELKAGPSTDSNLDPESSAPLIALELTPLVPLRRGTAIDISVRSPVTAASRLQASNNIMFRSRNSQECEALYHMLNHARIHNPTYVALQNARGPFNAQGGTWSQQMDRQRAPSSWWRFRGGRRSSYRASSVRGGGTSVAPSDSSVPSVSSAISALKRLSAGSRLFDVAKSTITSRGHGRSETTFSSSSGQGSGASTPIALELSRGAGAGITDTKVRMYQRETAGKWRDLGSARLTIMHPPRPQGMPPQLDADGRLVQEKRVFVTGKTHGEVILDATLGESSFERVARTGLAVSVWQDLGRVGHTGGVLTARANVFMIQLKSEAEAAHAFSLVSRLRY